MKYLLAAAAAVLPAAPAAAQPAATTPMTLEQTMLLRCSAVFAVVAGEQDRGAAGAQAYPPLAARGKEFFVRSAARLMDERHMSREQVEAALRAEAARFQAQAAQAPDRARFIDAAMQPCLAALEASAL
jgi:hypothetical protein